MTKPEEFKYVTVYSQADLESVLVREKTAGYIFEKIIQVSKGDSALVMLKKVTERIDG